MRFFSTAFILALLPLGLVFAQNKYIPPDPYSITTNKQHFSRYLIVSPGFLGPNALPVPRLENGAVKEKLWISLEFENYTNPREKTRDLYAEIHIPIAHGKASLDLSYVPFEFYQLDSTLSRERRTASGKGLEGSANGDVYFGSHVQLLRNHSFLPDFEFGMVCRTASGTKTEDARYTNAPGYYLDLAAGKQYNIGLSSGVSLRWFALIGFYVWQTFLDDYPQNDALLYGGGIALKAGRVGLMSSLRGYNGYMQNGDHPVVWRNELSIHEGAASLVLGYENGLRDYPFNCFRAGFRIMGLNEN